MMPLDFVPLWTLILGFGVFMYFPTLVEVPVARMFLDLGMHPGPLLAYLMADPELSLQSMLMVAVVIGRAKTAAYVGAVALFSISAGLIYGAWVDGLGWAPLALLNAVSSFSFITHFAAITQGVIDLRDLVFFFSLMALFLFANVLAVNLRRRA